MNICYVVASLLLHITEKHTALVDSLYNAN